MATKKPTDAHKPTEAQLKAARVAAEERIARAEARIREGNATREAAIADCEREKKKREIASDVVGALTWSFTALGLGQDRAKPKKPARR